MLKKRRGWEGGGGKQSRERSFLSITEETKKKICKAGGGEVPTATHPDICRSVNGHCYRLKYILRESRMGGQLATQ